MLFAERMDRNQCCEFIHIFITHPILNILVRGFVTEWMENGNVLDYLKKYGDEVDRKDLVSLFFLQTR